MKPARIQARHRDAGEDARLRTHAPTHLDAEVLSLCGAGYFGPGDPAEAVEAALRELRSAPTVRHHLADLLGAARQARDRLHLVDALYVELGTSVLSTDVRLARASATTELVTLQ